MQGVCFINGMLAITGTAADIVVFSAAAVDWELSIVKQPAAVIHSAPIGYKRFIPAIMPIRSLAAHFSIGTEKIFMAAVPFHIAMVLEFGIIPGNVNVIPGTVQLNSIPNVVHRFCSVNKDAVYIYLIQQVLECQRVPLTNWIAIYQCAISAVNIRSVCVICVCTVQCQIVMKGENLLQRV